MKQITELKTIQDIEGIALSPREKQVENYLKEQIKLEAIKWVKDRMKVKNGLTLITDTSKLKAEGMINDFIDFFNLTEEDLK